MISKVTVTSNVCWLREAYQLILNQVTKQSAGDFLKKQLLKYQISAEEWEDLYQYFKRIEEEFDLSLTQEERITLDQIFSVKIEMIGCMGDMILFFDEININETIDEFENRMANLTQEEIDAGFDERLNGSDDIETGDKQVELVDHPMPSRLITQHIAALNISDQEKWQIQEIYINFREYSEIATKLLKKAHHFMTKDVTSIAKYQDQFQKYWTKKLETSSIYQMLREDVQLDIDENPIGSVIYSNLIQMSTIKMAENGAPIAERSKTYFGLGILFGKDYSFSRKVDHKQNEQDLFELLKLLGDKSKFEILQFVADDWRYGGEIAKKMNLTSATISYHMNALVQARLVELKKEEKKIFYRQNQEYLSKMLVFCEKIIQNK